MIIWTTRSMRRLKPDPVPNVLIRKILEAGVCAPSGGNMQRWRFLVVRDPKVKETVGAFLQVGLGQAGCATVPVW
jgi:nitroreductase